MNVADFLRPHINSLKAYSSARDEFSESDTDLTFIDANENPYQSGVNRYPDPQQKQLKALWSNYIGIDTKNILFGNGSDEVLDLIFRAFCEPQKDNVIILPPTYGMYEVLAQLNNVEVRKAELNPNFQPNEEAILNLVDDFTKVIFICTPNNPTANNFDQDIVMNLIKKFNGIVVVDEAYIDFSGRESYLSQIKSYPNVIVTQTFSKAFGLAGIRLGICYATAAIIAVFNKIKPPYNVNELTQQKGIERLENINSVKHEIKQIVTQRERLLKELVEISLIEKVYPSDANFILVKVDDANLRYNQLIHLGIVVRNRTTQALCENCLRLTVGTEEENIKLLTILKSL